MTLIFAHQLLMSAGSYACPDYSTVTLRFTSTSYTPPNAGDGSAVLQFLPCSYTPPTVV